MPANVGLDIRSNNIFAGQFVLYNFPMRTYAELAWDGPWMDPKKRLWLE